MVRPLSTPRLCLYNNNPGPLLLPLRVGNRTLGSKAFPCTAQGMFRKMMCPRVAGRCRLAVPLSASHQAPGSGACCQLQGADRASGEKISVDTDMGLVLRLWNFYTYTQRLQSSSFLVMTYFLLRDYNIQSKNGTTLETLGTYYNLRLFGIRQLHGSSFPPCFRMPICTTASSKLSKKTQAHLQAHVPNPRKHASAYLKEAYARAFSETRTDILQAIDC